MTDSTSSMALAFTPESLDDHPEVNRFVARLGYGEFDPATLSAHGGRNLNWAGTTTTGERLFVKALPTIADIAQTALRRTLAYETVAKNRPPGSALRSPELLGTDAEAGLVAFRLVPGARGLNAVAVAGELEPSVCAQAGAAVGVLHGLDPGDLTDETPLEMPPLAWLRAMPVVLLGGYTMAQLAGWRLVQNDLPLVERLYELREQESLADKVPVHGDLRLDQFLISDGRVHLCDWEYFRLGDPARDVGALVGELVFQAIYLALTDRKAAVESGGTAELDHAEVRRRAGLGIDRAGVLVRAFWSGYRSAVPLKEGLADRAVGFAGWHMYDRLITWAEQNSQLNPAAKAIAGIGRRLLISPVAAARLLGLVNDETQPAADELPSLREKETQPC
jgi:hypothetical protein